jgi:hypothetical protein
MIPPIEKHFHGRSAELQIPPLRCASVGMTKGRAALPFRFDIADDEQQVPPLRFAPVGMTLLFLLGTDSTRGPAVSFHYGFGVEATRNSVWVMRMAARREPLSEPATLLSPPARLR